MKFATGAYLAAVAMTVAVAPVFGQTAPAAAADVAAGTTPQTAEEDLVILSPFEVTSSKDMGYSASETLGGNRLRTEIRDVGSAISVYTSRFLSDTGSVNARDLLVYTTNSEVSGVYGNFSATLDKGGFFDDTGSGAYVAPNSNTRIRGLAEADITRNFFQSDIPFDAYNIDRVDIQRGANSILFGLASPGGVVNYSLNQAFFRNAGSVSHRFDQYGTHRVTGDYNLVVIPGQLAVRVGGLYNKEKYQQQEAWKRDHRGYVAARYEPSFLNNANVSTSIKTNFEKGKIEGTDPDVTPPRDSLTYWWSAMNKATNVPYAVMGTDPVTGKPKAYGYSLNGYNDAGSYKKDSAGNIIAGDSATAATIGNYFNDPGRWYQNLAAVYNDPSSSVQGGNGAPGWMPRATAADGWKGNFGGLKDSSGILGSIHNQNGFWRDQTLSDTSIFDFYNHEIFGPNKFQNQEFKTANVSFSQTYFQNQFGFELAYDYQDVNAQQVNGGAWEQGRTINIDVNEVLSDGRANPNFGRPFIASDFVDNFIDNRTRSATRATVFWDLDLAKKMNNSTLGKMLGRHVFTGLWSQQSDTHRSLRYNRSGLDSRTAELEGNPGNPWNWGNNAAIHYVGDSLLNASSAAGAHLSALSAMQVPQDGYTGFIYNPTAGVWQSTNTLTSTDPLKIGVNNDPYQNVFGANLLRQKIDSKAVVWQGHLLDDVIVPTIGWREDTAKAYNSKNPSNNARGYAIVDQLALPDAPSSTLSGTNWSYSLVVHTPKALVARMPWGLEVDLTFNKSSNFSPSATNMLLDGTLAPPQTGKTKDYGVKISALNRKIYFSAIKYEASAENAKSGDVNTYWLVQQEINFWNAAQQPWNVGPAAPAERQAAAAAYLAGQISADYKTAWNWKTTTDTVTGIQSASGGRPSGFNGDLVDTVSKGYEFEFGGTPVTGWDISFNASKSSSVKSNNMKDIADYMTDRIALWTGSAGRMLSGPTSTTDMAAEAQGNVIIPYMTGLAKNGQIVQEGIKWRWNLINNYRFSSGALKGANIGCAVRWQDKVAIGYPVIAGPGGKLIYDISSPFFGKSQTNYDLWVGYERDLSTKLKWRIQLNAKNLFQGNKLIPIAAQPDGSIGVSRIAGETLYSITNTFSF